MSKHTRVVMVEIQGEDKNQVDRLADLLVEQTVITKTFLLGAVEKFAADDVHAGDVATVPIPEIIITNTKLLGGM
ncbi:MAG TPA: hypothetical protein VKW06_10525 [Candidatus Angelobacter sp.]|nr:hypothetical protein [Candidatus Angelobacter sp.]